MFNILVIYFQYTSNVCQIYWYSQYAQLDVLVISQYMDTLVVLLLYITVYCYTTNPIL